MLRLSKKTDYAIVALSHLERVKVAVSAREIAQTYSLPPQLVANVLKELASAKILNSKRGSQGGYILARNAEQINMGEVFAIFEGPLAFSPCSVGEHKCKSGDICPARRPLQKIHDKIAGYIESLSLADLIEDNAPNNFYLGSHI